MSSFLQTVRERVVIYDGAMGTNIQKWQPTADDFWGKEGCNEILSLSRPDIIRDVHAGFFAAGCDAIETNTFGATRIVLGEYGLQDKVAEINGAAARLAREVAADFSTRGRARFVAGSIGPTTKLPSLGHIRFDDMVAGYVEQVSALLEGGVDVLLIETCQDILQAKAALVAAFEGMHRAGKRLPVTVQVTLEAAGTMLLGTEIGAALTTLEPFDVDVIGMNCATGPREMNDAVRYLSLNSSKFISVLPNAGLPQNVGGQAVYQLTPRELAEYHKHFIADLGVRIVGGCCGTTPEHLRAVVETCAQLTPAPRDVRPAAAAASAYTSVPLDLDPKPLVVAEEMNTTTRKPEFRELVRNRKYDEILVLAKRLVSEGSHMVDLCTAVVGEDETAYMTGVLDKIATRIPAPILIDSTEAGVIEEALKRVPGKPIINSVNLEDGERRLARVLPLARKYGAAVICLTIDEDGMALAAEKKAAIARRIYRLATEKYGMRPVDLIFDALTLPISTGQEDYRTAGVETLKAVEAIRRELPAARTILGVSNISFGLNPYPRRLLNSVFMYEAVNHGLDIAIVNYSKIYPLHRIPDAEVELARKLVYFDTADGDPLQRYLAHFAGRDKKDEAPAPQVENLTIEEQLKFCIVQGEKAVGQGEERRSLEQLLEQALAAYSPLDLINNVLLDAMRTVGELFGARKMQLPSVLDSASVMKQAVAYLEPMMEKAEGARKGTIVLATVKGDVHDIGKNLVDIILSNNGFKVVNLGIKQPSASILAAAQQHQADAIGLSGLLVKSTLEMKYVLQDLEQQGFAVPVICGGAALTRKYVEEDLRREYSAPVFYANDAFDGLRFMEDLISPARIAAPGERKAGGAAASQPAAAPFPQAPSSPVSEPPSRPVAPSPSPLVAQFPLPPVPRPPFWGVRVRRAFDLREVFAYINETALFKNQWQLRNASQSDYVRLIEEKFRPLLRDLQAEVIAAGVFEPKVVWGYFPAQSEGNGLIVYAPSSQSPVPGSDQRTPCAGVPGDSTVGDREPGTENGPRELVRFTFPRQKEGRRLCIADFFRSRASGEMDVLGVSLVTIGGKASAEAHRLFEAGEYTRYLYLHGLSVETAEALAEYQHKLMRQELGISGEDAPEISALFHQKYRGSRYSFGYPACPHLEDQTKLFALLHPEENIGVSLTSGFLLEPEQSTSAIVAHHPAAKYFMV
jgi:5-methyltetrahydrofolate--homocysteine methyltransferase